MSDSITITYLNRQGGGFAERHTVTSDTTVAQFLSRHGVKPEDCTVRVVRGTRGAFTPTADETLQDGDRLSCVPLKIEGADE